MITKEELLSTLKLYLVQGVLTREEVVNTIMSVNEVPEAPSTTLTQPSSSPWTRKMNIAELFYLIGGLIIFIGLIVLIVQDWDSLNTFSRILVTLGSGICAYIMGVMFIQYKNSDMIGEIFFLLSGLLLPIGILVTMNEMQVSLSDYTPYTILAIILFVLFLASYLLFKRVILAAFAILFATQLYFTLLAQILQTSTLSQDLTFSEYKILLVGIVYVLLGYYFVTTAQRLAVLHEYLYFVGCALILGTTMTLQGYTPNQNIIWEAVYPVIVLGSILISIYLQSKSFLVLGAFFLMMYIVKITGEYFTSTLGWPIALVFCGIVLMIIGYVTFYLNKTYFAKRLSVS